MKVFALLLTLFSTQIFARGFVEAQFTYAKNIDNQEHFEFNWNENEKTVDINMRLQLANFRSDWHTGGFKLDKAHSAFISFPEMDDTCKLVHPMSRIPDYAVNPNAVTELSYKLKGSGCKELVQYYRLFGVVISFYRVPSLDDSEVTEVVRMFLVDAP